MAGDHRSRLQQGAGTGALLFATTIALVAVVGASLVRFPFGASAASELAAAEPSARPTEVSSATLTGSTRSVMPSPSPTATHALRIATRPRGARVEITQAGSQRVVARGTAPFTARVPEGRVEVRTTLDGHEPRRERLTVTGDRRHTWWLSPRGQLHDKVTQFATGRAPAQVTFSPDDRHLWVALADGAGVEVYRPRSGRRLARIGLDGGGAAELTFSADGDTVYASQPDSGQVFEIDAGSLQVRRRLATGGSATQDVALSPDGGTLYAADAAGDDVAVIDLASGAVERTIPVAATPRGLHATAAALYVTGFRDGELQRIALDSGHATTLTATGGAMRHLAADERRERLYASDMGTDTVFVHELDGDGVAALATTDHKPNSIALGAGGRVLYVANRGANNPDDFRLPGPERGSVLALDARTGTPLDAIVGGDQTTGLDVSGDGRLLAFSDLLDDRVQVYEVPRHQALLAGDGGRAGAHRDDLVKD